ncbi:LuxR family transcriptional regulator [Thioclava sp. BHET1]|nr:LuxR family transcriptional regulator [Thioclava sp. BHET1]
MTEDPQRMSELFSLMLEAETIDRIWELYLQGIGEFGFVKSMYSYTHFRNVDPDQLEDVLFLSNHDKDYLDVFLGQGLYKHGPMVRWSLRNIGAQSWRIVHEAYEAGNLSPDERHVYEFNRKMGVSVGFSISFDNMSARAKGSVGIVTPPEVTQDEADALWQKHSRPLYNLSLLMHLKASNLPKPAGYVTNLPQGLAAPQPHVSPTLTARQREALEWVAEGKTSQDIAVLMQISTAMVEKHLRLAREVLDVETTSHAVAKATLLNKIFVNSAHGKKAPTEEEIGEDMGREAKR